MKQALLSLVFFNWIANCYDGTSIMCSMIPETSELGANLSYLWGKILLQNADCYGFLTISPIIILTQIVTLKFYHDNPKIWGKSGILFCIIIVFEILLNLHYFVSALYYTLYNDQVRMPESFPYFCSANSIIAAFFEILHFIFLLIVPLYIVFMLRSSLKSNPKIWNIVYVALFIISAVATYLMWYGGILGLNIFGLCGITFIRFSKITSIIPIVGISFNVLFLIVGVFAIQYFKKHMPNSIGLRKKKRHQKQILFLYVIGYTAFGTVLSIIMLVLYLNCNQTNPKPELVPLITLFNYVRMTQCFYIFFIIFSSENLRKAFKKFLKKMFSKNNGTTEAIKESMSKASSYNANDIEIFNFEDVLLQIQQQTNSIDILKISQVVTIVSGIYIAYKQYYNIKQEYFNPLMFKLDHSQTAMSLKNHRKNVNFNKSTTKNIYYHEKMSVKINIQIVKDFIRDQSLLPKFGILECSMIVHSPKIFQHLLENDKLQSIFQSFELQQNARKMFDLAEGQGGKSGEFFFYSADNKFVLKTITPDQFGFLDSNLLFFHQHFNRNPDSLLAKIYGLFTFKGDQMQRTYHLILMKNMLACHSSQIIRTYDLKGSRYDREVNVKGFKTNELQKITLKDIDFMKQQGRIHVSNQDKKNLQQTINKDTLFLKNLNLIDYSLLVIKVKWIEPPQNALFWSRYQRLKSFANADEYYHIGIIDYLQQWDLQKKGQKWWKILMGKKDISAEQPKYYQNRFATFVGEITQQFCLRKQINVKDDSQKLQNCLVFNKNKFQQDLLKLKRLERQGQYLQQKIRYLTVHRQQIKSIQQQNARQQRGQIQMSLSNKIGSSLTREKQQAYRKNEQFSSSYHQDQSQRSRMSSPYKSQSFSGKA